MAAGLKNIQTHIKSITNIKKITSTMKLVSAAKFIKVERSLVSARPLGEGAIQFYISTDIKARPSKQKSLLLAFTSDRGLCGSMHTRVCRRVKNYLDKDPKYYELICIGEKGKSQLASEYSGSISLVVNGIGHRVPTFVDACLIASKVMTEYDYASGSIVYCKFRNLLSFNVSEVDLYGLPLLRVSPVMFRYECDNEDEDLQNYLEFSTATIIYYCLVENHATELASRVQSMSNSSKNAGDLAAKLKIDYNRRRQTAITSELIDIVSGASVVNK